MTFVHVPPQLVVPVGHAHVPAVQTIPPEQETGFEPVHVPLWQL
jgi:hypothetical protein